MARIYLSSTSHDLDEQRKAVISALRRLGHETVAMEDYVAQDKRPLDKCLADVESCDVYIGLFAWRYGHVPETGNPAGLSFTAFEYECAATSGKPCLIFLLSEEAAWPRGKMDRDSSRIDALREELKHSGRVVNAFETAEELARKVTEAVVAWEKESGLAGEREAADWHEYRTAVLDRHQWVRLQVIAGASRERDPIRIPLTEVFEPQFVVAGASVTDVPDEVRRYQQEIYGVRTPETDAETPPDEDAGGEAGDEEDQADPADGDGQLLAGSPERVLDILSRDRAQVFLGGPGAGKSTLLQYAMLRVCEPADEPGAVPRHLSGEPVPFVVELRGYVLRKDQDFVSYLVHRAEDFYGVTLDAGSVAKALKDGKAIVFFDGLDEVFDPDDRRRVIDQFQAFARHYPDCRIVVTSRIAGYDRTSLGLAGFQHYTLMPLTIAHIRSFAGRWYRHYTLEGTGRTAEGLVQRIEESPRLLDLAGNPMLLTMMAVIYKDRDLPNERWRLYQRCAETLLEDWDLGKGIKSDDFNLAVTIRTSQKSEMLQRVAMYMIDRAQAGSELNAIAYGPLQKILTGYLTGKYQRPEGEAEAIAVDILKHLMERTYVLAGVGERIFGFVHRTFMEYFAACRCLAEFNARSADFTWLKDEIFGAHWQDPAWEEVLLLLIAMLHDQGTPVAEVVEHLRNAGSGRYPYHVAFVAQCLGEISDPQEQRTGQQVLTELVTAIGAFGASGPSSTARAFVDPALGAFSALAAVIEVPDAVRDVVARLGREARTVGQRVVAWQMGFALRSRRERLGYALAALKDPVETVRRGAIAVLEREWPGRADITPALAAVVSDDGRNNVRLAALSALERSWPHEAVVLDAIEKRAEKDSSSVAIKRFIEYLGVNWSGNGQALLLLMKLVDRARHWDPIYQGDIYSVVAVAIARGWPNDPEAIRCIQRVMASADSYLKEVILRAWARNWAGDAQAFPFMMDRVVADESVRVRMAALEILMEKLRWEEDPGTLEFIRSLAVDDVEASVRSAALRGIVRAWPRCDENVRSFVRDRSVNDRDGEVREQTFLTLLSRPARDLAFVRGRAAGDPAGAVRGAALAALARTRGLDRETRAFVRDRIINDPDPSVRGKGLRALVWDWRHFESEIVAFLNDRIINAPDASVRGDSLAALVREWRLLNANVRDSVQDKLVNEQDVSVRVAGLAAFAEIERRLENEADVLALLKDRAANDREAPARAAALGSMVRVGLPGNAEVHKFVEERAVNDTAASVRETVVLAMVDSDFFHTARDWLEGRAAKDPDADTRAAIRAALDARAANARESPLSVRDNRVRNGFPGGSLEPVAAAEDDVEGDARHDHDDERAD